jgi:peptide/nickel transport system permease protein
MARFISIKLGRALLTLLIAVTLVFFGVRALPGDLAFALTGGDGDPGALEAVRSAYGLDRPAIVQYLMYLGQVLQGNFGRSSSTGLPVGEVISKAVPVTLQLALMATLFSVVFGLVLGVLAAVRQGKAADMAVSGIALLGLAVPTFWLGMMGILVFAIQLKWLPASGFVPIGDGLGENLRHIIMPALVLGVAFSAVVMRQTRSAMVESLSDDFIRTAKAKGVPRRSLIFKHALRNSLIVVTTVVGLHLGALIAGAVITEQIFILPGVGKLTMDAVFTRDYMMIQGLVMVVAASYIVINLLVDLLYALIDPRIRLGGRS